MWPKPNSGEEGHIVVAGHSTKSDLQALESDQMLVETKGEQTREKGTILGKMCMAVAFFAWGILILHSYAE